MSLTQQIEKRHDVEIGFFLALKICVLSSVYTETLKTKNFPKPRLFLSLPHNKIRHFAVYIVYC